MMMQNQGGPGMMGMTMQERMMMQNQGAGMMDAMSMYPSSMMGSSTFMESQFGGTSAASEMEFQRLRQLQQMRMMEQDQTDGSGSAARESLSPGRIGGMGLR
jgi:hypothetical protein